MTNDVLNQQERIDTLELYAEELPERIDLALSTVGTAATLSCASSATGCLGTFSCASSVGTQSV